VPKRQTREDLRYTDVQIERMEAEDEKAAAQDPVGQLVTRMGADRMSGRVNGRAAEPAGADA
jgi:hypothetical protein